MTWRPRPSLTVDEARDLHYRALVIDTMFPASLSIPSPKVRAVFERELAAPGAHRAHVYARTKAVALRELWAEAQVRDAYLELWQRSGVNAGWVAAVAVQPPELAYERAIHGLANEVMAPVLASGGRIRLAVCADDIERAHRDGAYAILVKFDNSTPIGADLGRIDLFYNFGVRSMQLTYNLRNLVGDGCTERNGAGLSRFGVEFVRRLNERGILVDLSHANEKTAWDALEVSSAPVWVSHGCARKVFAHDRCFSDELLKAVASKGGYVGVVAAACFLQPDDQATLDHFVDHVEHFARVAGIDAVGIGTDFGDIYSVPQEWSSFEKHYPPGFPWHGFGPEHRTIVTNMTGYRNVEDWPNLTIHLARRGFNEDEIRKMLGLNFLRLFRDVVG